MNEDYVNFVARTGVSKAMTAKEIEEASANDEKLVNVRQCIKTGNWAGAECASYKLVRSELCVLGKLVLRGCKNCSTGEASSQGDRIGP